jgi:hypothetical protein
MVGSTTPHFARLAALLLFGVVGCTIERSPHLYPANDAASATGVLEAHFVGHGNLHGTAEMTMPDGEVLQGEYSIVADGSISFGSIFGTVYGRGGAVSGSGMSSGFTIAGSGQGAASLYGNRGVKGQHLSHAVLGWSAILESRYRVFWKMAADRQGIPRQLTSCICWSNCAIPACWSGGNDGYRPLIGVQ